jgi:hypothetical protein
MYSFILVALGGIDLYLGLGLGTRTWDSDLGLGLGTRTWDLGLVGRYIILYTFGRCVGNT